ncbi:MAG: hypothetical protein AAGB19_17685 [Cyanobacteria bacterium P01_F01_bin.3]
MSKFAVRLMGVSLMLGMGLGVAPAFAQETGVANNAEDFQSADAQEGFLGSGMDIWDFFHSAGRLSGAGQVDEGFHRSQSRRINREAESLRLRQQEAILQQEAAEANPVDVDAVDVEIVQ